MRLIDADELEKEMKSRQDACAEWRDTANDDDKIRADAVLSAFIEFKLTLDKMPTIEQPHWIPVTERPPEEEGMYLVTFDESCIMPDEGQVSEACWLDDQWQYEVLESSFVIEPIEDLKVTAWMPLPPSYKGDEK